MSGEKELSNVNFFVCSTFEDLTPYRSSVISKIRSKAGIINAQEFFGSRDQKPLETCLEEVQKSNVFVMFLAFRYGSVVGDTGKSFVECEYDKAKDLDLLKLIYLMDPNHPIPFKHISTGTDADKLAKFKERLRTDHTIDTFTTPDDLADKVFNDLQRALPRHGFVIGTEPTPNHDNEPLHLLRKFVLLPKIHYGSEFNIDIVIDGHGRATQAECDAFSLRYGATLKSSFHVPDNDLQLFLSKHDLSHVWTSEEIATQILSCSGQIKVTLKTMQGQYLEKTPVYSDPGEERYNPFVFTVNPLGPARYIVRYETTSYLKCGLRLLSIA